MFSVSATRRFSVLSTLLVLSLAASLIIPRSGSFYSKERSAAQLIQQELHRLESAVSSTLLDREFFKELIDVIENSAPVTNDIVEKMNAYSSLPFTIYVYERDSLLFWSKPGLIIDPAFFSGTSPPIVASDHADDYLIKAYTIYHDFTSYTVYAKIPLIPATIDRSTIRIVSDPMLVPQAPARQIIKTLEGDSICAVDYSTEKLNYLQQLGLLFFGLLASILFVTWLPAALRRFWPAAVRSGTQYWVIGSLILLRVLSFLLNYHDAFHDLPFFRSITQSGLAYGLGDLVIDSLIFCAVSLLWARTKPTRLNENAGFIERNVISVGSYLLMILAIGLFAWVQRWLVIETTIPINMVQADFISLHNAAIFGALASVIFGLFILGQRILYDLPRVQPSIYRRTVDLILAGLLSVAFISMLDLGVPLFGFYLAVLSTLLLFDLYVESNSRSVIWLICWSMLIAGFEASLLHNYRSNKDETARFALAQQLSVDLAEDDDEGIDNIVLKWLPSIPSEFSLGVFKDGKLAYSYNHAYPLLEPERLDFPFFTASKPERSEVGYRNGPYTVIIGKQNTGLMQIVSLFSYIFALFNIILFFIALVNSFFHFLPENLNISFSSRPTLRNRIQVAIVFLIILSFVIIGFVTVFYLRNTSEDRDKKYFEERLRSVATSISQAIPSADSLAANNELVTRIAGVAYVYNRRAKIFDENGSLILQSTGINSSLQRPSIKMSFVNKFEMDQSDLTYSIQTINGNKGPSYHGLLSLQDDSGKRYGYVELPGTAMNQAEQETGSRFLGTLLNAYVFLFLIAVALAIGVANSITRPLAQLGDKLKQIKLGKKNEEISWGIDDEIGALINDYNLMIQKLDESAQLLALTERDTAWREMAKQVAHEIKNPLTPMKLSIQYLQKGADNKDLTDSDLVKRVCHTLIEQIDNLSTIASEFSSFAKMPQADNEKVLLNEIVASVHDLFRKREDMDVQLYVPIQDIIVFADRNQLVRVLNNVVKNAIQAVPDDKRGKINISLIKKGDSAIIKVEDNGSGISSEMRDKVFRPNFTTKSSGTGLGLAICANIIESFNGRIYFETEESVGTVFYIELPLMKFDDNLREQERILL